jgi:hypothetical protein
MTIEHQRERNAQKQRDLNQRRRDAGLVSRSVWVTAEDAKKVEKMHRKGADILNNARKG